MAKCPACAKDLVEMKFKTVAVDVCRDGCCGVWFDQFEFKKIDQQAELDGDLIEKVSKDPKSVGKRPEKLSCPKCKNIKMMTHFESPLKKVQIDECPGCAGIWLDAGELFTIRSEYRTEAERDAAVDQFCTSVIGEGLQKEHDEQKLALERAQRFAKALRFLCPSNYIKGKQDWGAF